MSTQEATGQEAGDELSLQFEDGEFIEECNEEGNNTVQVSPMISKKRSRDIDDNESRNKREKVSERHTSNNRDMEFDCMAKIDELVRPCTINQSKKSSLTIDECIVIIQDGRDKGARAFLHRADLYIYGKRMHKADFIDILNKEDKLHIKITREKQGRLSPKGKHAIHFRVVKAWLGKLSEDKLRNFQDDKKFSTPSENDPERKNFLDYLKSHNLNEDTFRSCCEGRKTKKPFFPLPGINPTKVMANKCFVASLVTPPDEGDGATCGILEVAEGPLAAMLWGFDQMCLYIWGVRVHCNDLNRLFLSADKVGKQEATYLTVEATWIQSSDEARFWNDRVGPALKKFGGPPDCRMIGNLVYVGDRPKAPQKFEPVPSVEDILQNRALIKWLESQRMEPQFFHDLLQGTLPPLQRLLGGDMSLSQAKPLFSEQLKPQAKPLFSEQLKPLPFQPASNVPVPLMARPISPLSLATEQFLSSPSKRKGTWPEGWTDERDKSRGKVKAFDRLGPQVASRGFNPRSRHASPDVRPNKHIKSPVRRTQSPEIRVLSPRKPAASPRRPNQEDSRNAAGIGPKVNLTNTAVGNEAKSSHVTGTLHRVERIVNGVLQCVSHDDPKVDSIITDKADLQMAMFISKTLTTAIIRYNTGAALQKQSLPTIDVANMSNLPNANVGVVKPMNMSSMGLPAGYAKPNEDYRNVAKPDSFKESWNMMQNGMGFGSYNRTGSNRDAMTGFREAASAAGFHMR